MILCKCCVTYLLNGEILLLFIRTWPSRQKRAHSDRTLCSTVTREPLATKLRALAALPLMVNFIGGLMVHGHSCMPAIRGPATMTCSHQTGSARSCHTIVATPPVAIPPMATPPVGGLRKCGRRTLATKLRPGHESIATLLWQLPQICCGSCNTD